MAYVAHIAEEGRREQSILEHLSGTAKCAAESAALFDAAAAACRCGMLHDAGKYSCAFQRRIHGSPERVDHSTAGAVEARRLGDIPAAICIAGHHGGLPNMGGRGDGPASGTLMGRTASRPGVDIEEYSAFSREVTLTAASHPKSLVSDAWSAFFYTHMLFSCLVDADWLDTEAFMSNNSVTRGTGQPLRMLYEKLNRFVSKWWGATEPLNIRRCSILRGLLDAGLRDRGPYTLTVPTGGGKTVGSMAFAMRHALQNGQRRVIYVIPYTSIIEQTQAVFEEIFGAENVVAHYANVSYPTDENGNMSDRDRKRYLASENWDAPVILTTAVQFFESLFGNRPSCCRKLHNIVNSVIIFDEAQMLPVPYMLPCVKAIAELVKHYRCTALLCTATQPALDPLFTRFLPAKPVELCPDVGDNHAFFRRVRYQTEGRLTDIELAGRLIEDARVLCVVNTRAQAQRVFRLLPSEGSFHLSTLMTPANRQQVLATIRLRLKYGETCRVVSTSLIEAGVDLDFPTVWRAMAGLDSIIQSGGRCNREGKRSTEQSTVHIFDSDSEPPRGMRQNIAATHAVMDEYEDIASPEAIDAYFRFLLYTLKDETELDRKRILPHAEKEMAFETVAHDFRLIDDSGFTIYIPLGEGEAPVETLRRNGPNRALMRKLGRCSVSVYEREYMKLMECGALEPVSDNAAILLQTDLYDGTVGLGLPSDLCFLQC